MPAWLPALACSLHKLKQKFKKKQNKKHLKIFNHIYVSYLHFKLIWSINRK